MPKMVSTRGIKLNFLVGERVLCYEPDPTKAKVLYDSKVLDVVFRKDQIGKKVVEYLIHFQGWNPSWDRCVGADYILKDNPSNRQLQKDLAERAQLQLGAYLYRKERKKHIQHYQQFNRSSESEGGSNSANPDNDKEITSSSDENDHNADDIDDDRNNSSDIIDNGNGDEDDNNDDDNDDNSSMEDGTIEIELLGELKEMIKADYYLINKSNKRLKLPMVPNVVTILEKYYHHYANNQLCGLRVRDKIHSQYRKYFYSKESKSNATADIQKNLMLCKEVIDGLRIYFDFTLNDYLLYEAEKDNPDYYLTVMPNATKIPPEERKIITSNNDNSHMNNNDHNTYSNNYQNGYGEFSSRTGVGAVLRKRCLRSSNKIENHVYSNGNSNSDASSEITNHTLPCSSVPNNNANMNNGSLLSTTYWHLLPDYFYNQNPPPPCLVYGAIHLTRLFVKLPEFLNAHNNTIPDMKMKIILRHVDLIIDFLNEHKEWYGGKYYRDYGDCN